MQSTTWDVHGRRRLADAIRNGEPLAAVYNDLAVDYEFSHEARSAFCGAVSFGLLTLQKLRSAGFKFRGDTFVERDADGAALEFNGLLGRNAWRAINDKLACLVGALEAVRGYLQVEDGAPAPAAVPEPEPLPVRIVAMPDRLTETKIERDEKGNIAASLQIERDAHVEA
jgi:hypothetical protein